jgi:prophage antirepressor-like protein
MARRRLRSSTVVLGGMGVLALAITSCGSEPDRRCADWVSDEVLPSSKCDSPESRYYYGGKVVNGKVTGGSYDKEAVERGGFGCSSSGGG